MIQPFGKAEKFSKKLFYDTKVIISIIQPEIWTLSRNLQNKIVKKMDLSPKKLEKHYLKKWTQLSSISHSFRDMSTCLYWQYSHVLKITLLNPIRKFKTDFQSKEKRLKTYCSFFGV